MTDFREDWLQLRAAADARARADGLVDGLGHRGDVLDLGAGTGANLRYLAPRLGGHQHWVCVDRDQALLAHLAPRTADWAGAAGYRVQPDGDAFGLSAPGWSCAVRLQRLDLATDGARLQLPEAGLVTASALLDLVSADWLDGLLARARSRDCRLLFALSYDGRVGLEPTVTTGLGDARIIALVNRHQRGDKGFGPALGPGAAAYASARCRALGYRVECAMSDWHIGPSEPGLQSELLDGWRDAAMAMAPVRTLAIHSWHRERISHVAAGRSRIRVGHQDLVARPLACSRRSPSVGVQSLVGHGAGSGPAGVVRSLHGPREGHLHPRKSS